MDDSKVEEEKQKQILVNSCIHFDEEFECIQ